MRAALIMLAACGSAQPKPTPAIVDADDRCPTLPRACLEGFDPLEDDGCPDPILYIQFDRDSDAVPASAARMLQGIAHDAPKLGKLVRLFVSGFATENEAQGVELRRVLAVISALRARDVPAKRLVPGHKPDNPDATPRSLSDFGIRRGVEITCGEE